jgi:hypothetical protein
VSTDGSAQEQDQSAQLEKREEETEAASEEKHQRSLASSLDLPSNNSLAPGLI